MQAPSSRAPYLVGTLFRGGLPDTVPVLGGRGAGKVGDAGEELQGRAVVFTDFQTLAKGGFRLFPFLFTVELKGVGVDIVQLGEGGIQTALARLQFKDPDGFHLAKDGDEIDLPHLDVVLGQAQAFFVDQDAGAIDFVHPLQSRGDVHGVADDGKGFGGVGTDRADHSVAGGEGHAGAEPGHVAPQAGNLGDFTADSVKGF